MAVALCLASDIREPDRIDMLRPVAGPDGALGPPPINPPAVPQITIPTTLSGGEFSAISGVTDERIRIKERLRHPDIMPRAVVLDPASTVHTPEWLFLSAANVGPEHFERVAEGSMKTPWIPRNPRPIAGPSEVREILELAARPLSGLACSNRQHTFANDRVSGRSRVGRTATGWQSPDRHL